MPNFDNYIQDELDKVKNERSLSIAVGDGSNLIAVSEFRIRHNKNTPNRYSFFVTKPGAVDTHVCIVLDAPDVHALIGILQEIIDKE